MSVVPREKAGAGAAVNNSVRQVGGALGVAILGSVLAASYSAHLGGAVDDLPAEARAEASQSIVATLEAVAQVEASGDADAARAAADLVEPAREAFVSAMHVTAVFTAGRRAGRRRSSSSAGCPADGDERLWASVERRGVRHAVTPWWQLTVDEPITRRHTLA